MKHSKPSSSCSEPPLFSELLVLADGRILAHNVTAPLAELLRALVPADGELALRVGRNPTPRLVGQEGENRSMKTSEK